MILYGVSTEVSIGESFIAGFGPGFLIGFALMLFVYLICKKRGWGKNDGDGRLPLWTAFADLGIILGAVGLLLVGSRYIAPAVLDIGLSEQTMERYSHLIGVMLFATFFIVLSCIPKLRASLNGRAAYALMMPVIILGGIYGGVFTPTEASAVAVIYALFVGMVVCR